MLKITESMIVASGLVTISSILLGFAISILIGFGAPARLAYSAIDACATVALISFIVFILALVDEM